MVQFKQLGLNGSFTAIIDNVDRFKVVESESFSGGWILYTLEGIKIKTFPTLGDLETYIEEMDK